MSSILKYTVSFIYAVFAGISTSLSSLNVGIYLFFDSFLLFLVVSFFVIFSLILILGKKNVKIFFIVILDVLLRLIKIAQYLLQ